MRGLQAVSQQWQQLLQSCRAGCHGDDAEAAVRAVAEVRPERACCIAISVTVAVVVSMCACISADVTRGAPLQSCAALQRELHRLTVLCDRMAAVVSGSADVAPAAQAASPSAAAKVSGGGIAARQRGSGLLKV